MRKTLQVPIGEKWQRLIDGGQNARERALAVTDRLQVEQRELRKIDGRSLRKAGRTEQVNIRLKQETKLAIQRLATANGWLIGEVIERSIATLEASLSTDDRK